MRNNVVVKFLAYSEKPEDVGRIGEVQRVHQPLYKNSIGVRGASKATNNHKTGQRIPCITGFSHTFT